MAEAGKEHAGLGLPVGEAAQWPLQRYGRFMPSGTGEPPGPGQEAGMASSPTWKVRPEGGKGWEALTRRREGRTTAAWFLSESPPLLGPQFPPTVKGGSKSAILRSLLNPSEP